jgi:hypothetical protein
MVKKLGIVFIVIVLTLVLVLTDSLTSAGYLRDFLKGQSIGVIATLIALNVATVTFLLGNLMSVEQKAEKELFKNTKTEIRHNVFFMFGAFFAQVIFVIIGSKDYALKLAGVDVNFYINSLAVFSIILVFTAIIEVINSIFEISHFWSK